VARALCAVKEHFCGRFHIALNFELPIDAATQNAQESELQITAPLERNNHFSNK
jgi:hypothetical protein